MTTWNELSSRMGRNNKPHALVYAVVVNEVLTDPEEVAKGFEDAWTACEWPGRAASADLWLGVLGNALDIETEYLLESEVRPKSELPESVTLYRGAPEDAARGMSWTDNLERAQWFASRFPGYLDGNVYTVEATPDMVLARFHESRGENEWVLDPDFLPEVEDMEVVA